MWADHWVAACLVPVAVWILLSGLDDLFIDIVFFLRRRKPFAWPADADLARTPQRRIAILVPLWRESAVIGQMLHHNLAVLCYGNYDIFAGVYPNDQPTINAVKAVARSDSRVHLGLCPHAGPTSKGDCLNWAYQRMAEYEMANHISFEIVMIHDAEDLIHPDSLRLVNWFSRDYEMVQVPVLPLPTRWNEWTHGLYCDEFAEFQSKDIPVRQMLGGFLPSNGVGTAFGRRALEHLRKLHNGYVFDPGCLTEDYENGFRMYAAGHRQLFIPLRLEPCGALATREYFPRGWKAAVRQRSRWLAGIGLQGWQHHGWRVPPRQLYWLWRDRKGFPGNLISVFANILAVYCLAGYFISKYSGQAWHFGGEFPAWVAQICIISMWLTTLQMSLRVYLSARVYGLRFAIAAPLRLLFWGNWINGMATIEAVRQFTDARIKRCSVPWRKTEHIYPDNPILIHRRPLLGEVLVRQAAGD